VGLCHASAPHACVLCQRAGSNEIEGCPGHPIPPLGELVELHERIALPARRAKVAGIALNTAGIPRGDDARDLAVAMWASLHGLVELDRADLLDGRDPTTALDVMLDVTLSGLIAQQAASP